MKSNSISPFSILGKFARVVKMWQQLEKQPRRFGLDEDLHSSEIHLVEVIGSNDAVGVTDLAKLLGVTKGAVSQTLGKLVKKELVHKYTDPENSSKVVAELTSRGKIAYYAHEHWHQTMDGGFKEYFTNLPEDKIRFLDEFLSLIEAFLEKRT
ncbi:MAG: winged helix-turn-helix transcriptional regulator [Deltaproteobacteria bacterium]|nr:winged helix-turn-helix transcriptional regulator [Deltaproteobacteria bacterium]